MIIIKMFWVCVIMPEMNSENAYPNNSLLQEWLYFCTSFTLISVVSLAHRFTGVTEWYVLHERNIKQQDKIEKINRIIAFTPVHIIIVF